MALQENTGLSCMRSRTEYDESESDIISALISRVNELIQSGAEIAEIAATIEAAAETAQEVIDSIPADYSELSDQVKDLESRIAELEGDETGGGLSSDVKTALMNLVNHISWDDDTPSGQTYITALYNALYPATESDVELISINAVYTQTGTVYSTDTLDSLKADLTVTGEMSDESTITISDYILSGTLTEGTSVITVNYDGKTTTFDVIVSTSASPTPTPTPSNAIKISDYYPFVRGFMQLSGNGQVIHQTTYERGCSALLVDVPISAGDTVSLPSYSNLKVSISKTSGEGYVVADISEDYTFSAQDVEDAKSIIIAHLDRTYFEDEDIAWVNENAVIIKAQSGGM